MKIRSYLPAIALIAFVSLILGCGGGSDKAEETPAAESTNEPERTAAPSPEETTPVNTREQIAQTLGIDLANLVKDESGLEYVVREEGTGDVPTAGQKIKAHYTGYLLDGRKFDSSVDRGQPFETDIGVQRVIKGWDIAFTQMKVGEKRVLFIPAELGYGARGAGTVIPPNAELVFDVELIDIVQ